MLKNIRTILLCLFMILIPPTIPWLEGYLVDPAFLGFFTPFIILTIMGIPIVVLLVTSAKLIMISNRNRRGYVIFASSLVASVVLFLPFRPTSIDGFYYRMGQIDESDYVNAANLVIKEADLLHLSSADLSYPVTEKHNNLVAILKDKNPIFRISNWPIHVSILGPDVEFSWGSGLTGSYGVVVVQGNKRPKYFENAPVPPNKLYKDVFLMVD